MAIRKCEGCRPHEFQDTKYGKNMRVWTSVQGSKEKARKSTCTVCGKQETLYVVSK